MQNIKKVIFWQKRSSSGSDQQMATQNKCILTHTTYHALAFTKMKIFPVVRSKYLVCLSELCL